MRLTDVPRTLAMVRPEVAWPAEVQRTLDLALARDAADRYQSAAQFGREFAAAVAEMPETAAADAGTVVVSLPATRVAKPGGATAASAAGGAAAGTRPSAPSTPAAPPTGGTRRTPLLAGGLVGAAAIAGVIWKLGLVGGGAPAATGTDSSAAPLTPGGPAAEVRTATPGTDVQLYAKTGAEVPSTDAVASRTTPTSTPSTAANARTAPGARPTAPATPATAPAATPSTTPTSAPAATDASAQLSTLLREAQSGGASRVIRELAALQPTLSGTQLGESYYVQMIAYTDLEDQDGVCKAAKKVIATHTVQSRIALAQRAAQLMQCDGEDRW